MPDPRKETSSIGPINKREWLGDLLSFSYRERPLDRGGKVA